MLLQPHAGDSTAKPPGELDAGTIGRAPCLESAVQRIADLLKHQRALAAQAQMQLNTLQQCSDSIEVELERLQNPDERIHSDIDGIDGPDMQQLQQPGSKAASEERPFHPHGREAATDTHPALLPGEGQQEEDKSCSEAGAGYRKRLRRSSSRVLEVSKSIEADFADLTQQPSGVILPTHYSLPRRTLFRVVNSTAFDMFVVCVIVANTITMSVQLQVEGKSIRPGICDLGACADPHAEAAFLIIENAFASLFAVELVLRLIAVGPSYFKTPSNIADCIVVILSCLDAWVLTPLGTTTFQNIAVSRLMRLARLTKMLRVVRVMKSFKALRVLVLAVEASVGALVWSMTLLFVLMLVFAILMAQLVRATIEDLTTDMETRQWLWSKFGTWYSSMLTCFELTMAPGSFSSYRRLISDVNPVMGLILVIYVCSVSFAIIRILSAMFLKATLSASSKDEAWLLAEKSKRLEKYFGAFQQALDTQGEEEEVAIIEESDLKELLASPPMTEWLAMVSLEPGDAILLRRSMAKSGPVELREYLRVLMRMRGNARSCELVVLLSETEAISNRLSSGVHAHQRMELHAVQGDSNLWAATVASV